MDATKYPWYEFVSGPELAQGDLIFDCEAIVTRSSVETEDQSAVSVDVEIHDVIVLTQTCDLANGGKVKRVHVCPTYTLAQISQSNNFFQSTKGRKSLSNNELPAWHLLDGVQHEGFESDFRVVDFRAGLTLDVEYLREHAVRCGTRPRLLPPFRELLSQQFARFFMRVAVPQPIELPKYEKTGSSTTAQK